MKLSTYITLSRHGVYYFRWPIPASKRNKRTSVRISLRTRCATQAGTLSRFLACCGQMMRDRYDLQHLRQDEIRTLVRSYFQKMLDQYLEKMNDTGLSERSIELMQHEMSIHENAVDGEDMLSDVYFNATAICDAVGLSNTQWDDNLPSLRRELRKGRRDMLQQVLEAVERLEHYSFDSAPSEQLSAPVQPLETSSRLGEAVDDFVLEHSRQWATKTTAQNRAYLNILLEYFGPDKLLGTISKQDASEVKKVLQELTSSRNTKPKLKAMPLMQVIKEPDHKKIAAKTINSHIQMFKMFFDWAERHGHAPHTFFEGMKVKKDNASESERKPFAPDQAHLIYTELTENPSGLVRKDSHKWGMLLGMFTGARLNEICQLDIADVQQDGDTWFLNITDEGDDNKSVKSKAGRRKVPLHFELIQLGFLDFVESRRQGTRLFPDYSYSANGGYGRNLGRWCNESFLPKLGIKQPGLVFHSLRHTVVTRLSQADVPEPIVQCIVGHARSGVTQEVYNREGYTLNQLKEAIGRFQV